MKEGCDHSIVELTNADFGIGLHDAGNTSMGVELQRFLPSFQHDVSGYHERAVTMRCPRDSAG